MTPNIDISIWEQAWRYLLPYLFIVLLFSLEMINYPILYLIDIKPFFVLMSVYFWTIFRPKLFPIYIIFSIGIIIDLLMGYPLGISSILFIIINWSIIGQRRFLMGVPYYILWFLFSIICIIFGGIQWGILGLINFEWSSYFPVLISTITSILLFPPIAVILILVHKLLPIEKHEH